MSIRSGSRGLRWLALLVSLVIAVALASTIGIMVQLGGKSDDLEFLRLVPWMLGGLLIGFGAWYVLDSESHHRSRKRRGGHLI